MLIYYCIYIILVIMNMQSYIENAELIKHKILTSVVSCYGTDVELITKNKNKDEYINALNTYTLIAQSLINVIIEYTNDVKKINIKYNRSLYTPQLICIQHDYWTILIHDISKSNVIELDKGNLSIFKSIRTSSTVTNNTILSLINQHVNNKDNYIDANRTAVFFNTYMNYKYSISNYFENINLNNINCCYKLEIDYDKFSMIVHDKNNINIDHVVTVENPEQFEEIINITKLFYDLFKK